MHAPKVWLAHRSSQKMLPACPALYSMVAGVNVTQNADQRGRAFELAVGSTSDVGAVGDDGDDVHLPAKDGAYKREHLVVIPGENAGSSAHHCPLQTPATGTGSRLKTVMTKPTRQCRLCDSMRPKEDCEDQKGRSGLGCKAVLRDSATRLRPHARQDQLVRPRCAGEHGRNCWASH
jgi:hypothetical protein